MTAIKRASVLALLVAACGLLAQAENGYEGWLRYRTAAASSRLEKRKILVRRVVTDQDSEAAKAAAEELVRGLSGLLGSPIALARGGVQEADVVLGTAKSRIVVERVQPDTLTRLGAEGFLIRSVPAGKGTAILIAAQGDRGLVYGTFHLLRLAATGEIPEELDIKQHASSPLRVVDHWDNLDPGRDTDGYPIGSRKGAPAKQSPDQELRAASIWKWDELPRLNPRYRDYARLLASVGINGVVVNNVNVSKHGLTGWKLLTAPYIAKLAALAGAFRPYGIRLYISVGFESPILIDKAKTADPLDPEVRKWWVRKADEIYASIPDFGGFLVKADSEQEPGPMAYHRTHGDGANMLAEALKPHGGIVMWRAFVYGSALKEFPAEVQADRARQAYDFFHALDGKFADNVVLQVKHGPIDFQLREPVSALFGGMPRTNLMIEGFDYWGPTGRDASVCYLAPMWKRILDFDTHARGSGSTVKRIISGELDKRPLGGSAAIITVGDRPNWTGQILHQANIYAYGRLSWDPELPVEQITEEWVRQTFGNDPVVVRTVSKILLDSWAAEADTAWPLGLGGPMTVKSDIPADRYTWSGNSPGPEKREKYHGADSRGVGIDRTSQTGTGYLRQYHPAAAALFASPATCPEDYLLFFHHLPYTYRLASGKTVIQSIYDALFGAVESYEAMSRDWAELKGRIDAERHSDILGRFRMQIEDARTWRDVMATYFFATSGIPDKKGRQPAAAPRGKSK